LIGVRKQQTGMKCSKCGAENTSTAKYCAQCGQELIATPDSVMPASPTADQAPVPAGSAAVQVNAPASPAAAQAPAPAVVQTVVGNRNIQVNLQNIYGSKIDIQVGAPGEPEPQPLPLPVEARPEEFPSLLDRQPELQEVASALEMRAPVEISGEMGLGKTSLLRALGNSPQASVTRFPGGVVYRRAFNQPETDLLQSLFSLFFKLPKDYKPSPGEIQRGLQDLQALVILDDVNLSRDELTDLRSQAPHCTFVMATTERALWGEGRALALGGLPPEDSLALIERELSRALTVQEQPAVRQLCTALKGNPDRLLKSAACIHQGQTIESILQSMAQTPLTPILVAGLPNPELRVLSVVALGKGAPVPLEHIAPLADIPDARPPLRVLEQQHLVQAHSPSYTLTGALAQELWRDWDLTPWAERAVGYFAQWAEAKGADPRSMLASVDVILQLLEWAVSNKQWAQVLRLGKAIQAALAVGLRWGAWLQVLKWVLMAAQALGERAAEGWALHQIGTHAVCVGDRLGGQTFLTQALQLRQAIGDQPGAAVTQHNLNLLLGPLAPPSQGEPPTPRQPPSAPASAAGALKWILPLLAVTGLVAVAVLIGIWRPWEGRSSEVTTPRVIRPLQPTRTPPPELPPGVTPPPEIVLELDQGCGQVYSPGTRAAYTYRPNRDGWVTLRLDGQDLPDAAGLEVQANTKYSGDLLIPRQPGEHVLSVFYDLGGMAITRECPFRVGPTITLSPVTPTPPAHVEVWFDPGQCGGSFAPGDPIGIHVSANQNGRVEFFIQPTAGASGEWFHIGDVFFVEVTAGQEAKLGWQAPRDFGMWVLKASLNDGQAEATCELQVAEKNPPVLREIALVPRLPCEEQVIDAFVFVEDDSGIESIRLFSRLSYENNFTEVQGARLDDFSYQFTFNAPQEGGRQFYVEIKDVNGNVTSTQGQPNAAYSGFVSSGIDYEAYCNAYLIWPRIDLPGMDVPVTPPVVGSSFECMSICSGNLSCQSFTWDAATNYCWMKDGVPAPSPKELCTSGKEFTVPIP
jgi:hypothetical protein